MYVIGTAGHVDHGKSTLVRALTGIDPDRLQEEKARGMTIDLGFAAMALRLPSGQTENVGIVDVPGHIDFIKNMLAGIGGIDAVVLVIAADEGVMPQTREHLAIVDLLAVPTGVVALTKIDLIGDPEWLELVQLDIAELLANTRLSAAPVVPVSATSGAGLLDLRRALAASLAKLAPHRNRARPRLPVDRVFSLSGHGTIVTGTLLDGQLAVGDTVEVMPAGLAGRVRSLQSHNRALDVGQPGTRLAINLAGVGTEEVERGAVVTHPGTLQATQLVDVEVRLLADAPKPLQHNQRVDFFCGAAETAATVRLLGVERLAAGETGWLQLRLAKAVVVVSGDRFILRQPSPSATLGGGTVLSPHPRRRWRRFDADVLARLRTLAKGAPEEILLQTLERQPLLGEAAWLAASELDLEVGRAALMTLQQQEAVITLPAGGENVWLPVSTWRNIASQLQAHLAAFHQQYPLRRGMPRGELRTRLRSATGTADLTVRIFNKLLTYAQQLELVDWDENVVWQRGFEVRLTLHQQTMADHLLATFARTPYAPPNLAETLRLLGEDEPLLEAMIEQKKLVRIGGDVLFRTEDYAEMVAAVTEFLQTHGSITLAQARDRLQTSRKYVQALLEEMDAQRLTRRQGDERVLR